MHVEHEAGDLDLVGDEGTGADASDVVAQRGTLIRHHEELDVRRIGATTRSDPLTQLVVGRTSHCAIGVLDHADASDGEQVGSQDERAERVVGHARAGVSQDLGVARHQSEHPEGIDARVDAGQHG